jgi:WD40 repeat protein
MREGNICVWKNTSANYVPWSDLWPRPPLSGFSFSPITSSILTWGPTRVQLFELGNCPTILSPGKPKDYLEYGDHLMAHSADGTHIATTQQEDNIVTVLDTLSNTPQQFFNTNVEIHDIRIVDNTIFVAGEHKVASWHLETGEPVHGSDNSLEVINDKTTATITSMSHLTLSDNCLQIAFANKKAVSLYDIQAQRVLCNHKAQSLVKDIRFSPDGCQLWYVTGNGFYNDITSLVKLERGEGGNFTNVMTESLNSQWSWVNLFSPHGWSVGDRSEWVMDSRGNKILWLPIKWRAEKWCDVRWDGNFLAFVHGENPIVIKFQS